MNYKAVIFDMDGVLIDSELHWDKANEIFFKKRGIIFTPELKAKLTGNSIRQGVIWMRQEFNLNESVEDMCAEYWELSKEIYEKVTAPLPGIEPLLQSLRAHGVKVAIASGSYLSRIEEVVRRFGWGDYFDVLASTDQVDFMGKPDPAVYVQSAKMLEIPPAVCVAIEDSVNGLVAAHGAGMQCIAAINERWSYGDFSKAELIVKSLEDKKVFEFLGIS